MKVSFYPHKRKLSAVPVVDPKSVKYAVEAILGTDKYDRYPVDLPEAFWGNELVTPRVLIREGYSPVDHDNLFGLWRLPDGRGPFSFESTLYDLVSGG